MRLEEFFSSPVLRSNCPTTRLMLFLYELNELARSSRASSSCSISSCNCCTYPFIAAVVASVPMVVLIEFTSMRSCARSFTLPLASKFVAQRPSVPDACVIHVAVLLSKVSMIPRRLSICCLARSAAALLFVTSVPIRPTSIDSSECIVRVA